MQYNQPLEDSVNTYQKPIIDAPFIVMTCLPQSEMPFYQARGFDRAGPIGYLENAIFFIVPTSNGNPHDHTPQINGSCCEYHMRN